MKNTYTISALISGKFKDDFFEISYDPLEKVVVMLGKEEETGEGEVRVEIDPGSLSRMGEELIEFSEVLKKWKIIK